MQKYLINKIRDNTISFIDDQTHHIINVMRNKVGSQLIGLDNNQQYLCEIISIKPLRAKIINKIDQIVKNDFELNVFQASIKSAHMDLCIIKACELNANNFYIFEANLSQKNIIHNLERYKKLMLNACQQCSRTDLMNIEFIDNINNFKTKLELNDINLIAHFSDKKIDIKELIYHKNRFGIITGPEGGWNDNDFHYLKSEKNHIINLTKTILRSETATIYLLSVVNYIKLGE